ncbi:ABC transporter ATP-binding protein [Natrinema sp. SYSU A 869]|uniref:ABC transporter ATP-binding protein n=1 Tax=Natrinema sp. SYSU A 869 TaxID=2871694 RepID=UPI001CA3B658|nr:ABC transporter ATP-binding protein [Natrinema sp. SYSU A 869]
MSRIDIDDVTKSYGAGENDIIAVDDVSLHIDDGEFVIFVGPSGSGKSTLLRIVAGLEEQTEGDVVIGDTIVNELSPRARNIAMVFQNYALYPNMTVEENMSFGLKMSTELSSDEIEDRVHETAETMGIDQLLENTPGEMSGGQQQRVALGRAIVRDPDIFLMDEPLSNLDAKLRTEMRTEINRLQNELDVTTLYVTHDQTEAMTMGDRLVVLNHGEIQQVGTPLECFYRPTNQFVAGFLGSPSMNFFDGRVEGSTFRADGFDYDLTEQMQSAIGDREELVLGIRPEDVTLHERGGSSHEFEAVVDVVEPMGSISYVYLRAQDQTSDQTFIVETDDQYPITEGQHVYVEVPHRTVHLFNAGDGETIHQRQLDEGAEVALRERKQTVNNLAE